MWREGAGQKEETETKLWMNKRNKKAKINDFCGIFCVVSAFAGCSSAFGFSSTLAAGFLLAFLVGATSVEVSGVIGEEPSGVSAGEASSISAVTSGPSAAVASLPDILMS